MTSFIIVLMTVTSLPFAAFPEDLWIEVVLSRYVNDEIDRETAIELVGRDRVKRAERELQAVSDDVQWGLDA
ncbi:hypothetical protein [Natrinema soli]|uniref:Uncharacterized protein n=1 Tax=Natrinema soli TaxID=1930624 RepID=A0ABD5SXI6_9EURY|nr:hypothetical protein [Natrinema soli]